ncbi:hypothetical protein BKA70DRAFT_1215053 [Coprinopsis sp. MPI-PUGE-AT-0042]|nr:hypothetical protein BKA70DRAFT_1215053 [Coprinopsis sp. MPI-PUGE-AT-0042]
MSNLHNQLPIEDRTPRRRRQPKDQRTAERRPRPKGHRASFFRRCEALEFHNCHFTYSGRDSNRSDVHDTPSSSDALPNLPSPDPAQTPSSTPDHYLIATAALLASFLCLLGIGYLIAYFKPRLPNEARGERDIHGPSFEIWSAKTTLEDHVSHCKWVETATNKIHCRQAMIMPTSTNEKRDFDGGQSPSFCGLALLGHSVVGNVRRPCPPETLREDGNQPRVHYHVSEASWQSILPWSTEIQPGISSRAFRHK